MGALSVHGASMRSRLPAEGPANPLNPPAPPADNPHIYRGAPGGAHRASFDRGPFRPRTSL